ncbi:MAG: hypothetical protein Q7W05_10765, partial [Deltaproteobacteria bacterium]|nr:hypothetical protein [Deltaproteobacteria bacterium]
TFSEFIKNIDIILLAYAFVTGYYPRDSRYVFSADDASFEHIYGTWYETLPHSLKSGYSVFPSSRLRIYFSLPHKIEFPQQFFNSLCNKLKQQEELSRVLFLIVEGHTLSTEMQATVYTVALEAMTGIISKENETKYVPITSKTLSKKFIGELLDILNKYSADIPQQAMDTLKRKISVINTPTNKDKLLKPFELLGIKLVQKEIDCINKRNDFLHGRLPLVSGDSDQKYQLQQIATTLLYCVSTLVLKYVGYTGYVMYYPTLNEYNQKKRFTDYLIKSI